MDGAEFAQLSHAQIQKLKDAFQYLDENSDGRITKEDLLAVCTGLGMHKSEEEIIKMIPSETQDITFPSFLALMGEKLSKLPETSEIENALRSFSSPENGELNIDTDELLQYMSYLGPDLEGDIEAVFKTFVTEQLSGKAAFKGNKFLEAIGE
ncbi:LAMI_0H19900g1_1 [Lachancea mirantina]|uniref:LAMI_0H19900g1_1 n=1 Tax=Lachancea mirantina TaxID=1230905 RepID=A0A1G4KKC8_9SACH|nr:LAMI_0H19900g1_1 [Lachancea mirantina]